MESWLTARGHTLASIVAYNGMPPSESLVSLLRFRFRSFLFSVSSTSLDDPVYFWYAIPIRVPVTSLGPSGTIPVPRSGMRIPGIGKAATLWRCVDSRPLRRAARRRRAEARQAAASTTRHRQTSSAGQAAGRPDDRGGSSKQRGQFDSTFPNQPILHIHFFC